MGVRARGAAGQLVPAPPRVLCWVVGNANYHHVHHLSAKIPNYHLRAAHEEQSLFAEPPVVTIRSSLRCLRLKLWDEDAGALVAFPALRSPVTGEALLGRSLQHQ